MAKMSTAEDILDLFKKRGMTLALAESLTGGLVAARITEVPGASAVFKGGFVVYSNRAKKHFLGVKKSTLRKYGAVSRQTAKQMACGGAALAKTNVCIALTGNAGPDASEGKPVGLVYIGCCCNGNTIVKEHHFKGSRAQIRESCVKAALGMIRACVEQTEQ